MPLRLTPLDRPRWALNRGEIQALEQATRSTTSGESLMEQAGLASAQLLRAALPHARRVSVLCGPGNNGGDGLVMARWLHLQGLKVDVHQWGTPGAQADRAEALRLALAAGVSIVDEGAPHAGSDCLVDALLGTGLRERPRGAVAKGIDSLRSHGAPIMALDLPSGLDADEGADWGAVPCHWTLTFLAPKPGLFTGEGRQLSGETWLADLGAVAPDRGAARLFGASLLPSWRSLSPRALFPHSGHKGRQGDVWVLGGEPSMAGAARLAAQAALLAGAGRVYWVAPEGDPGRLEVMHRTTCPAGKTVVAGCGGGEAIANSLPQLLNEAAQLVLDADALNALARTPNWDAMVHARSGLPTVLTPHPLEAARLLQCDVATIQNHRLSQAQALAERTRCTVVLKGSGTVVAHPGRTPWINTTGHAALGTAGTGDVLAGWLGGLLAQAPEAPSDMLAALAVAWHGAAADQVPVGAGPLTATALLARMAAMHP